MKNFKTQKGITLVALVITIIVLLILAVVAIGAVRDSGIIGHAQNSADKYNSGKLEEESVIGQYEDAILQYETEGSFGTSGEGSGEEIEGDENQNESNLQPILIEGTYGVTTLYGEDYFVFNSDNTGKYYKRPTIEILEENFTYTLFSNGKGTIIKENNENFEFKYKKIEGSNGKITNEVIYIIFDEGEAAYTTNDVTGLPVNLDGRSFSDIEDIYNNVTANFEKVSFDNGKCMVVMEGESYELGTYFNIDEDIYVSIADHNNRYIKWFQIDGNKLKDFMS